MTTKQKAPRAPAIHDHDPAIQTLGEWLRETAQIAKDHPTKREAIAKIRAKTLQATGRGMGG